MRFDSTGYTPIDWQSAAKFINGLMGSEIHFAAEIPSTQTAAKEAARRGAPHGAVFVTDFQSAGKGRRDRGWQSLPRRDLTFSLVTRPDMAAERAPLLSLAASVAIFRALEGARRDFGGGSEDKGTLSIKWPNDILIEEKKVCGIICDSSICAAGAANGEAKLNYAVIGIGVNVNRTEEELMVSPEPAGSQDRPGKPDATSLRVAWGREINLPELFASALNELDRVIDMASSRDGVVSLMREYRANCGTIGRGVNIITDDGDYGGTAADITDSGSIAVRLRRGDTMTFSVGDVVHARRVL
ncbi:biotin--[acetyl-CoA-carboxylase] ligase [Synergistales bacterium]|nr:biotin--[acetyl-CoA-carboxylase] ligase [Synergistales bacterium]